MLNSNQGAVVPQDTPAYTPPTNAVTPTTSNVYNPSSGSITTPAATQNINSSSLQSQTPSSYNAPTLPPPYPTTSLGSPPPLQATPQEQQATATSQRIQDINTQLSGKAADESALYKQYGFNTTTDANGNIVGDAGTADLQAKLSAIQNEALAIPLQIQNDFTGRASVSQMQGQSAAALRTNAVSALQVQSAISAKNGQLETAQHYIDAAMTQKYGPLEAELKAKTANLALIQNSPDYTLADKNRAAAQQTIVDQQKAALDVQKQNALDAQTEAIKYASVASASVLSQMQQATSPAEVAQIAAANGIQAPQAGRYQDQTTTVRNLDGSTSIVRKIFDTVTGQFVDNAPQGATASSLNAQSGASAGAASPSTTNYAGVTGTIGKAAIDTTSPDYTTAAVPNSGGLTQAAIDQKALNYLTSGNNPPVGRTGIAGLQNTAVSNRMAEMGAGANLAANKSQLKSLSSSLTQQTEYLNTTQRAFNTANDTLTSLQTFMQQNNINPSQFPDFNTFSNYLKSKGIDPGAAGGYNAQITTLRQEYSQVLAKGGARSVETDNEAKALIPNNLSPTDLARVAAQIKIDGENVTNDAQKQVTFIQDQINKIVSPDPATVPSGLPSDIQDTISKNVTFSPDGKTAYLPRSVWSTLGGNMDAVLAEAKKDGYSLLIQ